LDGLDSCERRGSVTTGDVFIIDSLPAPAFVRRRARARRCRKAPGRTPDGCCAAKREKFFGWRVHLVCRPDGAPVRVQVLPAGVHDLTTPPNPPCAGGDWGGASGLPAGARLSGDKADNSAADAASILAETGVRPVPARRATMRPHAWLMDAIELREYRHTIETVSSQLEKMGAAHLTAGANAGFELKAPLSALIALICTNVN
jgi:hypothetical protein